MIREKVHYHKMRLKEKQWCGKLIRNNLRIQTNHKEREIFTVLSYSEEISHFLPGWN